MTAVQLQTAVPYCLEHNGSLMRVMTWGKDQGQCLSRTKAEKFKLNFVKYLYRKSKPKTILMNNDSEIVTSDVHPFQWATYKLKLNTVAKSFHCQNYEFLKQK